MKQNIWKLFACVIVMMALMGGLGALTSKAEVLELPDSLKIIEAEAFYGDTSLDKVLVPEGVTTISSKAFAGSSIKKIELPESLTFIAVDAFEGCHGLHTIVTADSYAEEYCRTNGIEYSYPLIPTPAEYFKYVTLDDGTLEITRYTGSANEVIIPSRIEGHLVTSIAGGAFRSNNNLTSIIIPEKVTRIGNEAFYGCFNLASVTMFEGLESIGNEAFVACDLVSLTLPDGLTSIGSEAFSACTKLKSITIPDSVISIGKEAFANCDSLTSIRIPKGVTAIREFMFNLCDNLTSVIIPEGIVRIERAAFQFCTSLTDITIPDSLTSIGSSAFNQCHSLSNISLPKNLTSIGDGAFSACRTLTNVIIPEGITVINEYVFGGCENLASIVIPNGITSINHGAFMDCTSLVSIHIPPSVSYISAGGPGDQWEPDAPVFYGCSSLKYIRGTSGSYAEMVAKAYMLTFIATDRLPNVSWVEQLYGNDFDDVFKASGCDFNNKILKESARMAKYVYDKQSCISNLVKLGFFEDPVFYNYSSGEHTVGLIFSHKYIVDTNGAVVPVYAVMVRGTSGLREWISNFDIGGGTYHEGLKAAADDAWIRLRAYINSTLPAGMSADAGGYKVWLSGHSRGAAVVNLLAGDHLLSRIGEDDIYAYGFATPFVAKKTFNTNCIKNYIIGGDFVPRVPPSAWGYERYGVNIALDNSSQIHGVEVTTTENMSLLINALQIAFETEENFLRITDQLIESLQEAAKGDYSIIDAPLLFILEGYLDYASFTDTLRILLINHYGNVADLNSYLDNLSHVLAAHHMETYLLWIENY